MSLLVAAQGPSTAACALRGRTSSEGDSSGEPVTLTEHRSSRWEEIPVLTPAAAGEDVLEGGVTFYLGLLVRRTLDPVVSVSSCSRYCLVLGNQDISQHC